MSIDRNLIIDPVEVNSKIIEFIQSTLEKRDIEGLVILFRDNIESLVNANLAISAVGSENVKVIVTQGRFSEVSSTREKNIVTINKYLDFPQENIVNIDTEGALQEISKIFLDRPDHIHGRTLIDTIPVLNYNLSYILLRSMARNEIEERKFIPPEKKPVTDREKFLQRSIAYYKSQIRLNMLLALLLAETENKSYLGSTNRTEWLLGLFTKFGTYHAADFLPLANLFRTQVVQLADHLGFQNFLQSREFDRPTSYNYFFNTSYNEVDRILTRLDAGLSEEEVYTETGLPKELIKKINHYFTTSLYARSVPLIPEL